MNQSFQEPSRERSKNEVSLGVPYVFLGKNYTSLNQLFIEIMKPENYSLAIKGWETGTIIDTIKDQVDFPAFDEIFDRILQLGKSESEDGVKPTRLQLGLVHSLLNPESGFVVDGVQVTLSNLEKFIDCFFYFKKEKVGDDEREYLIFPKDMDLLNQFLGKSDFIGRLKTVSDLVNNYSEVLTEYQCLTGKLSEDWNKRLLSFDEATLKRFQWLVNTYTDLVNVAESKNLVFDKHKAIETLSRFEPMGTLDGIHKLLIKFKKEFIGAEGDWGKLYHQEHLDNLEVLLLLSTPENYLMPNKKHQVMVLAGMWLLVVSSMLGLIAVPYLIIESDEGEQVTYIHRIGSDRDDVVKHVQVTGDGGMLIGGHTTGFGIGKNDFWVVKIDKNMELEWSKTVGGSDEDIVNTMLLSQDQGFYLGGVTASLDQPSTNSLLVKLDHSGGRVWERSYNMGDQDEILGLSELAYDPRSPSSIDGDLGDLAMVGKFTSNGSTKPFVVVSEIDGKIRWYKKFNQVEEGYGVAVVVVKGLGLEREVMVLVNLKGRRGQRDLVIFSFSENGDALWQKTFLNFDVDNQRLVLPLPSGVLLVGKSLDPTAEEGGKRSYVDVIKVDYTGNRLWYRRLKAQTVFHPLSFTPILSDNGDGGDEKNNFLLLSETSEPGQPLVNSFYLFSGDGNYVPLENTKTPVKNSLWAVWNKSEISEVGEIVFVGQDDYGSGREHDIWVMKKEFDLP